MNLDESVIWEGEERTMSYSSIEIIPMAFLWFDFLCISSQAQSLLNWWDLSIVKFWPHQFCSKLSYTSTSSRADGYSDALHSAMRNLLSQNELNYLKACGREYAKRARSLSFRNAQRSGIMLIESIGIVDFRFLHVTSRLSSLIATA